MKKFDASVRFVGEDAKLLESLKKKLLPTHGDLSNIAVMRMAMRKMEQEIK